MVLPITMNAHENFARIEEEEKKVKANEDRNPPVEVLARINQMHREHQELHQVSERVNESDSWQNQSHRAAAGDQPNSIDDAPLNISNANGLIGLLVAKSKSHEIAGINCLAGPNLNEFDQREDFKDDLVDRARSHD